MTEFRDDEQKLTAFLRAHRPLPPTGAENLEARLLKVVQQSPRSGFGSQLKQWGVTSLVAASFLMAWGGYRWLNPEPNMASRSDELEVFLVNNWDGVLTGTSSPAHEVDWQFLTPASTASYSSY